MRLGWKFLGLGLSVGVVLPSLREGLERAPYFQLQQVSVEGVRYLDRHWVVAVGRFQQLSYVSNLAPALGSIGRHPLVARVTLRREFPHGVVLTVRERAPFLRLELGRETLVVSEDGVILPLTPEEVEGSMPLLRLRPEAAGGRVRPMGAIDFHHGRVMAEGLEADLALLRQVALELDELWPRVERAELRTTGDVVLTLGGMTTQLFLRPPGAAQALRLVNWVYQDLVHRGEPVTVIDGRYQGQVVVRRARPDPSVKGRRPQAELVSLTPLER